MHSPLASPKATVEVLTSFGLYTKKSLGQHFLVDDNVIGRILDLADIQPHDVVVEVGPGIGTLTVALVKVAEGVVAVERDDDLIKPLRIALGDNAKFALVHADAVEVTNDQMSAAFGSPTALVANLPYQVAATVVLRFFEMIDTLQQATVMVQSEVAERMSAVPGSKIYGGYTAKLNMLARSTARFQVARNSFMPPPRVDSTVIRLERDMLVDNLDTYRSVARVIDAAFSQRRKTIRNCLKSGLELSAEQVEAALLRAGIDGTARAETLDSATFITLAQEIQESSPIRS